MQFDSGDPRGHGNRGDHGGGHEDPDINEVPCPLCPEDDDRTWKNLPRHMRESH